MLRVWRHRVGWKSAIVWRLRSLPMTARQWRHRHRGEDVSNERSKLEEPVWHKGRSESSFELHSSHRVVEDDDGRCEPWQLPLERPMTSSIRWAASTYEGNWQTSDRRICRTASGTGSGQNRLGRVWRTLWPDLEETRLRGVNRAARRQDWKTWTTTRW